MRGIDSLDKARIAKVRFGLKNLAIPRTKNIWISAETQKTSYRPRSLSYLTLSWMEHWYDLRGKKLGNNFGLNKSFKNFFFFYRWCSTTLDAERLSDIGCAVILVQKQRAKAWTINKDSISTSYMKYKEKTLSKILPFFKKSY